MPTLFPRHSVDWKIEEPASFRRLTLSLVETALLTGVVLRLLRVLLRAEVGASWLSLAVYVVTIAVVLCLAATAHLSNYPVRQWLWRAPAFAALATAAEMVLSLALIALHREQWGTGRADFHDWPTMAAYTLLFRLAAVCVFALALAAVVQTVRFFLVRHEHRESTLAAVHEERMREEAAARES
ncbi:MAG: hypothetical protein ACJ79S_16225 [Gemmatimonadaceae bacterium]